MKRPLHNLILILIYSLSFLLILQGCESGNPATMLSKNDPIEDMVRLEGGTFPMNAKLYSFTNGPSINVMVSPFYLSRYEVTFNAYDSYTDDVEKKRKDDNGWGRGERPVINISWNEARDYTEWLSKKYNKKYRLPTEAEWEYAYRAGSTNYFPWGAKMSDNTCWYIENSEKMTHPVGTREPNPFGLYDMCGNVWEWVNDYFSYFPKNSGDQVFKNPKGGSGEDYKTRVERGGAWNSFAYQALSSFRFSQKPKKKFNNLGFRIAMDFDWQSEP
jgi:formylglycine-generating enzyme required for sulfatase activity